MPEETSEDKLQSTHLPLIDKYEEDYRAAMKMIDGEVKSLIKNRRDMTAIFVFTQHLSKIQEIHQELSDFYSLIFNNLGMLQRYKSDRLRQLGHEPIAIFDVLKETDLSLELSDEEIESFVLKQLKAAGFHKKHWYIKARILSEVEYMLEALRILVEPDFVPLDYHDDSNERDERPDRYVPSSVKIEVWRRDEGKCCECNGGFNSEAQHRVRR